MPPTAATNAGLPAIKTGLGSPGTSVKMKDNNQIHTYHKLFWRLNVTLEFNIFLHTDRHLYEIAAYNSEKGQEFVPLFLSEEPIKKLLMGQDVILSEIEKLKLKMSKDRFVQMPDAQGMIALANISIFNKFVESRLNPQADGTLTLTAMAGEELDLKAIVFTPPEEEDDEEVFETPLDENVGNNVKEEVEVKSVRLKPIKQQTVVARRQRSSIHEFNKSLNILKKDSKSLSNANRMTENLLNLSVVSVDAFKNALQLNVGHSSRYDKTTPLGLFRWAVHRIVLQRYVDAVRVRIDSFERKKPIRINGTFPSPGSTDMHGSQAKILSLAGRLNANAQMQSLSETLSREGTPLGTPQRSPQGTPKGGKNRKTSGLVKHSVSLPVL